MLGKRLSTGNTIGIVCPASAEYPEKIKDGISFIKSLGFKVREGKNIYKRYGYLAGTDSERASDLMEMFEDKNVDMILCYRGGYGCMRMLKYLDFDIIKNNPKIFAGFSDITVLLNSIYEKCGLITFHSPMVSSNLKNEVTLSGLLSTLEDGYRPYEIKVPECCSFSTANSGSCTGTLVGGNLSLICATLGTPYEINTEDKILFIEDVNEEPYKIDRLLTQLELANKLECCKGFIIGQFEGCILPHYERSLTLEQIFKDKIYSLNKPCIVNFPAGHGSPRLTLPIGANVKIDVTTKGLSVLDNVVN